jgi:hypothetical protein
VEDEKWFDGFIIGIAGIEKMEYNDSSSVTTRGSSLHLTLLFECVKLKFNSKNIEE